jgi:hypothetical protein
MHCAESRKTESRNACANWIIERSNYWVNVLFPPFRGDFRILVMPFRAYENPPFANLGDTFLIQISFYWDRGRLARNERDKREQ